MKMILTKLGIALGTMMLASIGVVNAQQVLAVGVAASAAPFSFYDESTQTERGITIEIMNAIGRDLGFGCTFVQMPIGNLIQALNSNKFDLIATNLLISDERKQQVDFADPLARGGDGLVVAKDDVTQYLSVGDLRGQVIGTLAGSPYINLIQKAGSFPDLKLYPTALDVMKDVEAGRIKAGVVGGLSAAWEIKQGNFPGLQLVKSYKPLVSSFIAIAVRKNDGELLAKINREQAKLQADGTFKTIFAKYGIDWTQPK